MRPLWRIILSIYIRPLDKPALDSWPTISQLLPTIVLDSFPPNATSALGMKLGNTGLAFFRKVYPNPTALVQEIHGTSRVR